MSYADAKRQYEAQTAAPEGDHLPCGFCGKPTARKTLSAYGARCFRCYEAYCGAATPAAAQADKRVDGPKGWAHSLKAREEAGERLTGAQRQMWREALRRDQPKAGDEA